MMASPPPLLSSYDPRCLWMTENPGGATSSLITSGASDVIQVSLKQRKSRFSSKIVSWSKGALRTAERVFSTPILRERKIPRDSASIVLLLDFGFQILFLKSVLRNVFVTRSAAAEPMSSNCEVLYLILIMVSDNISGAMF